MNLIRISKLLSEKGLCSRREADRYIEAGWVKVDGEIVKELGSRARRDQKIELSHQAKNSQLSNKLWLNEDYELTIKFNLIKRIKYNKREFMVQIGYKDTDNLMGCRIYKYDNDKITNLLLK